MIETVHRPSLLIVTQKNPGKFAREEALLVKRAQELEIPFVGASEKMMANGKVDLPSGCFVAGSLGLVKHALRLLGIPLPRHTPYPDALQPYLHRRVWIETNLKGAIAKIHARGISLFVKPTDDWKTYTGVVLNPGNIQHFSSAAKLAPCWASTPVKFLSEWRAYVANGTVLDVQFCDNGGDEKIKPDRAVIEKAVEDLVAANQAPSGFVIDFGVLDTGETALIEMNDGFACGAYGTVSAETYWDMAYSRWIDLTFKPSEV